MSPFRTFGSPALFLALVLAPLTSEPAAAGRQVAIIVDTSGSMETNDRQRYTKQLSQVISDLLDADDELTVIRMGAGHCSAGASNALALRLDPGDRDGFKRRLEAHTRFDTGTHYSAAVRTALEILGRDPEAQRLLLILADSGGLGRCDAVLTRELVELRTSGATVAAVNLGSTGGAFDGNPAFDFTTAALDAEEMVAAVAQIYQRFLGAKRVQTGRVEGVVEVQIAPHIDEAFLVVAADGQLGELRQAAANPRAETIDLDHRGGGRTEGVDGRTRVYRIVRLERPAAGRWTFHAPGLSDPAGWMLLQDSALRVRLVSPPTIAAGVATPLEIELYDRTTGERIADPAAIPGLEIEIEIDGRQVRFRDDGAGADRQAGDGILTAVTRFDEVGERRLLIRIESDFLDLELALEAEVVEASWALRVTTPEVAGVSMPVVLSVALEAVGAAASLEPPERVDAVTGGPIMALLDDGEGADEQAADRIYSAAWTPRAMGTVHLDYVPRGGTPSATANRPLEVIGTLELDSPPAVDFGTLESGSRTEARLDLNNAAVGGVYEVMVTSDFQADRSVLEIDAGNGWQTLGSRPTELRLTESGDNSWPLRLRVGECPEGSPPEETFEIVVEAAGPGDEEQRVTAAMRVEIRADPWLVCWWPVLALVLGTVAGGVAVHGLWSPSRFPPRLGVVLSPEENLEEGFFHPIRAQRGSGSGFYRDARIYVQPDFRLSSRSRGAVARLRADGSRVRIQPADGTGVWRRTADEEWQALADEETSARYGVVYRDAMGTIFFELRNG
ncbi:MAG: vWA domain-containing protein [Thermoanaerobaculia bacterium]